MCDFFRIPGCSCESNLKGDYRVTRDEGSEEPTRRTRIAHIYHRVINDQLPVNPKSPEEENLIQNAIESNEFIRKIISKGRMKSVIAAMYEKEVSANEIIIKEGERGNYMYISAKGRYSISKLRKEIETFEDVRLFGELSILYNAKRLATIKAITSGSLWVLDNDTYQLILDQDIMEKYNEMTSFLRSNELLRDMDDEGLRKVVNLLKSEFFPEGHDIVKQGDIGDKFFIINAGSVTVTKKGEGVVNALRAGDSFGELAITNDFRQATVTANPPGVECLTLTGTEFTDLIDYMKIMPKDSIKPKEEYNFIQLSDLQRKRTLGVGGFARVELVEYNRKKLAFALKFSKKTEIVENRQQEHVLSERKIQIACHSPFIVKLYRTFRDDKYVYFLMETCLGGDLWHLLYKQRMIRFEEKEAQFYVACMLEAMAFLHSKEIIYRDLKPENLLIAANGYLKLSDFGLAKKLKKGDKTFTFAGTPEYLAPEIVLREGYNKAVDCWQIGICIYEMLCRRTPFHASGGNLLETYNKILGGIDTVQFPTFVDTRAEQLIKKLCRNDPFERLGMGVNGIEDIQAHKWFSEFNWEKLRQFGMKPPFIPKLKGLFDTRYITETFPKDTVVGSAETSGWDNGF